MSTSGSPRGPKDDPSRSEDGNGKGKGSEIPFNYDRLNSSSNYISVLSGRAPFFDGTHYAAWRHKMKMHLISLHPSIWKIVCTGFELPEEDQELTSSEEQNMHRNA